MSNIWPSLLMLAVFRLNAQSTGEISGRVRDAAQTPISGARITVINESTRAETLEYTDSTGSYRVTALEPAYYSVKAFHQGFHEVVKTSLRVAQGAQLRLDFELPGTSPGPWQMPATGSFLFLVASALAGARSEER